MSGHLRVVLRAGERIFVNGAVMKVDRKVSLELLNDVVFLLEQHVMKPEDATTPLKQLYVLTQAMLMDPAQHHMAKENAISTATEQRRANPDAVILAGLDEIEQMLRADRPLDVLKRLRGLFALETSAFMVPRQAGSAPGSPQAQVLP